MRITSQIKNDYYDYSNYNYNNHNIKLDTDDGTVIKKSEIGALPKKTLPTNDVIDFAVNKELSPHKDLIGRDANILNLDFEKEISDMKRDCVLKEYQEFVQLPDSSDGIVRRLIR